MKFFKLTIWILALAGGRPAGGLSFLDPPFERLEKSQLWAWTESDSIGQRAAAALFLSEKYFLDGEPHRGQSFLKRALSLCNGQAADGFDKITLLPDRAFFQLTCAMALAESAARRPLYFAALEGPQILVLLDQGLTASTNADDKAYAEARVLGALPRAAGGASGKALLQWEILSRRNPNLTSPLFHQAKIRLQLGQFAGAQHLLGRIAVADSRDPRLRLFLRLTFAEATRELLDGRLYGIGPVLGVTPLAGFFIGARFYDDALFDTDRRFLLRATYGTRGEKALSVRFEDAASLGTQTLFFTAQIMGRTEDYYSQLFEPVNSPLELQRAGFELAIKQPILDDFYLQVGWRWTETKIYSGGGGYQGTEPFGGWVMTLGYDNTDSRTWKRSGTEAWISGHFAQDYVRETAFETWSLRASHHFNWGWAYAKLELSGFEGKPTPFGALTRLSGEQRLPGLREGRFFAPSALTASALLSANVWKDAWLELGLHAIALGPKLKDLSGAKPGASLAASYAIGKLRSQMVRLEAGLFGGELVVMGAGGLAF